MTVAYVQTLVAAYNATTSTEVVLSPSSKSVTVGNTIVVGFGSSISSVDVTGVTDNLGNVYSLANKADPANSYQIAELWSALVTVGGSITTITIALDETSTYDYGIAVELSGALRPSVGTDTYGTGTPAAWASNITIPLGGAVIGLATLRSNATGAAGSDSGAPSTAIAQLASAPSASWMAGYVSMAAAGAGTVTAFTGTTTFTNNGSDEWGAVSAIFPPRMRSFAVVIE
jgi:hypothetical protein